MMPVSGAERRRPDGRGAGWISRLSTLCRLLFLVLAAVSIAAVSIAVLAAPAEARRAAVASPIIDVPPPVPKAEAQAQPQPATPPPPPPPQAEPRAAGARAVLARHCARCHAHRPLLTGAAPPAGIHDILALDDLARDPTLVRPGEPDASLLYQQMIARQMPSDVLREGKPGEAPDAAELRAVRDWIASLERGRSCGSRALLGAADIASLAARWLAERDEAVASQTRFLSLAHIGACASDEQLARYRDGAARLVNALSWQSAPAVMETVGDDLLLLALRIGDLGWTSEHWRLVEERLPGSARILPGDEVARRTGARVPIVAADAFAAAVLGPDLNARLLGLPPTLAELARLVGVDMQAAREQRTMRRAVVRESRRTGAPRVVERYPARTGALWIAFDYPRMEAPSRLLDQPLLPWASDIDDDALGELARRPPARVQFSLPNGAVAFARYDGDGQLLLEEPRGAGGAEPPCRACHAAGPIPFTDDLRSHLTSDAFEGNDVAKEIALALLAGGPELDASIADDRHAATRAPTGIAAEPELDVTRQDPVTALAALASRDVDHAAAAARLLVAPGVLTERLSRITTLGDGDVRALALRLEQDRLRAAEFERLAGALDGARSAPPVTEPSPAGALAADTASAVPLRLELWAEELRQAGEPAYVVLRALASAPCHLTLVNVEADGRATVLHPNEFDRDNLLKPRVPISVPSADAVYRFARRPGVTERFVGICEEGEPVPAGITPDLPRRNFTPLGDWQSFLDAAHAAASAPRVPLDAGDDIDRRRGRPPAARPAPQLAPAQARAAIVLRP